MEKYTTGVIFVMDTKNGIQRIADYKTNLIDVLMTVKVSLCKVEEYNCYINMKSPVYSQKLNNGVPFDGANDNMIKTILLDLQRQNVEIVEICNMVEGNGEWFVESLKKMAEEIYTSLKIKVVS